MKYIIGKKQEMTQVWRNDDVVPVTKIQVGPCVVVQVKNEEKDGYQAVQLGYGARKEKNIAKPQKGHMGNLGSFAKLREFRTEAGEIKKGDIIDITTFEIGDNIQVTANSKGKGFQGVVKRYGFSGQQKTHGNKDQLRMPGSIGATGPAHVFKGTRMGGRTGDDRVTQKNLEIIEIDQENNILFIKGSIPGAINGLLLIQGEGELKIVKPEQKSEQKKATDKEKKLEPEAEQTEKQEDASVKLEQETKEISTEEKIEKKAEDNPVDKKEDNKKTEK